MEHFDAQKAIEQLSFVVGQALARLTDGSPEKQAALDYLLIHHEANAKSPSASLVVDRIRKGAEPMFVAMREARMGHRPPPEY
ncbi:MULTISPECIES: hypothetical protein [Acetobacter]|uniref:hypothetical protein n=1 Tax=Acetobacter TaxID=434 RepID=UPI0039EC9FD6